MVLQLVVRSKAPGNSGVLADHVRAFYPDCLHRRRKFFGQASAQTAPFKGCCHPTDKTRLILLDETSFLRYWRGKWDLFAVYRRECPEHVHFQFALLPRDDPLATQAAKEDSQQRQQWTHLRDCEPQRMRMHLESALRRFFQHVGDAKDTPIHVHMDLFMDELVDRSIVVMPRALIRNHNIHNNPFLLQQQQKKPTARRLQTNELPRPHRDAPVRSNNKTTARTTVLTPNDPNKPPRPRHGGKAVANGKENHSSAFGTNAVHHQHRHSNNHNHRRSNHHPQQQQRR